MKKSSLVCNVVYICVCFLGTLYVPQAACDTTDEQSLPSTISLSISDDDSHSTGGYLDTDTDVFGGLRLGVGYGNNANSTTRIDVKTHSYHVGIASNPLKDAALGIDYEKWGEKDALLMETWRLDMTLNLDAWSLRFSPAQSMITGYTRDTTLVTLPPSFEIDSNRYEASISYFSDSNWNATAGYTYINYSRDVSKVTTSLKVALALSPETLQLISVLDQRRYLFTLGYTLDEDQFGIDWSRMESALDSSHYTSVSAFYSKAIGNQWAVDLTLGQQKPSNGDKLNFVTLVLNYFW